MSWYEYWKYCCRVRQSQGCCGTWQGTRPVGTVQRVSEVVQRSPRDKCRIPDALCIIKNFKMLPAIYLQFQDTLTFQKNYEMNTLRCLKWDHILTVDVVRLNSQHYFMQAQYHKENYPKISRIKNRQFFSDDCRWLSTTGGRVSIKNL